MRREKFVDKKNKMIFYSLLILLLGISIGYAILSANLEIEGSSEISANTWDVHWENIKVKSGSTTNVTTPATIKANTTEVEFNVTLSTPGDYYEFTIDAVNTGSIDAMTSAVSKKVYESNGTTETTLPSYLEYTVTYADGVAINQNHKLLSGKTEAYRVRVYYKRDIESSQLPQTATTYVFSFAVTYVQSDSSGIAKPDPAYTYTNNPQSKLVTIGTSLPSDITTYSTFDAATQAFEHDFSLRHIILDEEVYSSELIFTKNDKSYNIKGGIDESSLDSTPVFTKNKQILIDAFGTSYCNFASDGGTCSQGGLTANLYNNGYVDVYDNSYQCNINTEGKSYCDTL